jgi:hypothetical protein
MVQFLENDLVEEEVQSLKLDSLALDSLDELNEAQLNELVNSVKGNINWKQPQNFMGSGGNTVYNPSND